MDAMSRTGAMRRRTKKTTRQQGITIAVPWAARLEDEIMLNTMAPVRPMALEARERWRLAIREKQATTKSILLEAVLNARTAMGTWQ